MTESNQPIDYTLKFIVIGNAAVGKSNISFRFINGTFCEKYLATIGLDFAFKTLNIDNKTYRIQIWDTAGQECFKSISRGYYKSSVCALIVYDITSRDSFNSVNQWIEECKTHSPKTITLVLVGNKSDLEKKRKVETQEGEDLAEKNNMLFYETSALSGENINKLFNDAVKEIISKINKNYYDLNDNNTGIIVGIRKNNKNETSKKKKCC